VNIVDLVDARGDPSAVRIFPSVQQLSAYTKKTQKFFPSNDAKAGGLLRKLLRQILFPPTEKGARQESGNQ
jgi:hypothetical protein